MSEVIETKAISIEGGDVINRALGEMHTNPFIIGYCSAEQFPLSQAAEAHAFIESRRALGRLVLIH